MIIPINLSSSQRRPPQLQPVLAKLGSKEIVLIELQGWLDVIEGEKHNGEIGTFSLNNDKPVLKIGHHLLEGRIDSLSKPLAVLVRCDSDEAEGIMSTQYNVMTIVKRKFTFSKRPVPLANHT